MPKLGSKKSRGGCTNCKRRRVKCDEVKPSCSNCSKYQMPCVYQGSNISNHRESDHDSPKRARGSASRASQAMQLEGNEEQKSNASHRSSNSLSVLADAVSSVEASTLPSPSTFFPTFPQAPYIDGFQTASIPQQPHFTLLDLELLHHYVKSTWDSLARHNTSEIWRWNIPELAYTRDWLMRGLISMSAIHMVAEDEPDPQKTSDLISLAATSLNAGLAVFNQLVATADLSDKETCSALASYTAVVAIYALAMPSVQHHASIRLGIRNRDEPLEAAIVQLYTSFELIRGTAEVYRKVWHAISTGPMSPLTQTNMFGDDYDFATECDHFLKKLNTSASPASSITLKVSPRRQIVDRLKSLRDWIQEYLSGRYRIQCACLQTHERLSQLILKVLIPDMSTNHGLIFTWPATLERLVMDLLNEEYPPALALLAMFALTFREASWLTRGWRGWILASLMSIRNTHSLGGEDINDVWWGTITWAAQLANDHPNFLEVPLADEGLA